MKEILNKLLTVCFVTFLGIASYSSSYAAAADNVVSMADADGKVESAVHDQMKEQRGKILQEAVDALARTRDALVALEQKKPDDALDSLAIVIGKLELIVARFPEMSLAPTGMNVVTHDLYATKKALSAAIEEAEDALRRGDVQKARRLLSDLGSEVVISQNSLPLATYPDSIKAITPLIDQGKIEMAKQQLENVLNTMVITRHVVPLPVVRAQVMLAIADSMAQIDERSDEDEKLLSEAMLAVREQLQMAELLGYGKKRDFDSIYEQLSQIDDRIKKDQSGEGFFENVKESISGLWAS